MIANLLPSEATHTTLDLFEKPPLLVTFENAFTQKIGPSFSSDGPVLEIEVLGDRNNFIDLQKIVLEIKCKITQANDADLRAGTEAANRDTPYFVNNTLHSLFSECTVSANGIKISKTNGNYAHKGFIEIEFSHGDSAKTLGWSVKDIITKTNLRKLTAPIPVQQMLVSVRHWFHSQLKPLLLVSRLVTF